MSTAFRPAAESTRAKNARESRARRRKIIILSIASFLLAIATWAMIQQLEKEQELRQNISVTGRIEGDESKIASLAAGRVEEVLVREGDRVKKGQLLIRLDDSLIQSGLSSADRGVGMAAAMASRAQGQIAQIKAKAGRVPAARAVPAFTPTDSRPKPAKKKGPLGVLGGLVTAPVKLIATPFTAPKKQAAAIRAQIGRAQASAQAQMQRAQANMQRATASAMIASAQGQRMMAQAELAKAQAAREQLAKKLALYKIYSPIDGTCTTRAVQPGDVVDAGQVLLLVLDPKNMYVRGFVPEKNIARVKIGQEAKIFLDGSKGKYLQERVSMVDSKASFTPENIYFKEDRVKQVFGIKVALKHTDGSAKPGMPADAEILRSGVQYLRANNEHTNK